MTTNEIATERRLPTPAAGGVRALLESTAIKSRFEHVLKERAGQFIASLSTMVYASPYLQECDPMSVIAAALQAAALNLPIERNLGYAAIVPYKGKAQFQMQWKGYVQLAHRTGQYQALNVAEVCQGEIRKFNRFTGTFAFGERTGDALVGYIAYFRLTNGFEKYLYMSVQELEAHGKRYSKGYTRSDSMWKTDPDTMYRKTVIKQLLTKWGVLSVEMQSAIQAETIPDEPDPPAMQRLTDPETSNGNGQSPETDYTDPAAVAAAIAADEREKIVRDQKALFGE